MRTIAFCFLIVSSILFFYSEIDPLSTTALKLLPFTQLVPFPAWIGTAALSLLGFILSRKKQIPNQLTPTQLAPLELKKDEKEINMNHPPESWEAEITLKISNLNLPPTAQIKFDEKINVPFTLYFDRSTPMSVKRGVSELAQFLANNPKPRRIEIILNHPLEGGVPIQNLITGALRQHLNINEFHLTSQENSFDVQFKDPQEPWISRGNISRKFH